MYLNAVKIHKKKVIIIFIHKSLVMGKSIRSNRGHERGENLSRDARKSVFVVSDQVQHKPGCTAKEDC